MKQIILGTAGHIDHGKTSLIKAVTGTDTDRLKEEKERGITIELGFASLDLPSGQHLGIVDVPGHEKFVKNMVAGATGIDMVVMIIAADEGVMPQTREHMEICTLLGVSHGFVALTKIDMVDEEWLELALEDIKDFVEGTFLEGAPIVPASSVTREGIEPFTKILDDMCTRVPERSISSLFRLPVDRVFTMKGFGTVITGSLASGTIRVGDMIMIYPSMVASKVRGIQVHNQGVNRAEAGQRTAINFQGLEKTAINRGEVLARPSTLITSYMVDIDLQFLSSNKKPIKTRTRVRFHTGTSEILGNLILLDREELAPGESVVAQLRLDAPVSLIRGDRFVIRSYSPIRTIGGGQVLNPIPRKHKRFRADVIDALKRLIDLENEDLVEFYVDMAGFQGASFTELLLMTNQTEKKLDNMLQALLSRQKLILLDRDGRVYIHSNQFEKLKIQLLGNLTAYHASHPLKAGMPKEELKSKIPASYNPKLFNLLLNQMLKSEEVIAEEKNVRLASHRIELAFDQEQVSQKIITTYRSSGLQPPYFKELSKELGIDVSRARDVLMLLVEDGKLIKVKEDLFFDKAAVEELRGRLVQHLTENGEINTPRFKEMTGASRKFVIPLIEYFDAKNVTIRVGDIRKLRRG